MGNVTEIIQDKESGVTVAIHKHCRCDAERYIDRKQRTFYSFDARMPDKIVAKVKLRDGDVWDDAVGVAEALHKADVKHNRQFKAAIRKYIMENVKGLRVIDEEIFDKVMEKMGYMRHSNE